MNLAERVIYKNIFVISMLCHFLQPWQESDQFAAKLITVKLSLNCITMRLDTVFDNSLTS